MIAFTAKGPNPDPADSTRTAAMTERPAKKIALDWTTRGRVSVQNWMLHSSNSLNVEKHLEAFVDLTCLALWSRALHLLQIEVVVNGQAVHLRFRGILPE